MADGEWFEFLSTTVAGVQHHAFGPRGTQAVTSLAHGAPLKLVREPENEHDRNAVRIDYGPHKVGYISGSQSRMIAALLDKGYPMDAMVDYVNAHKKGADIAISLHLRAWPATIEAFHAAATPLRAAVDEGAKEAADVAAFRVDVSEMELPGEAVGLWIRYRPKLAPLDHAVRAELWRELCAKCNHVGGMKNAGVWLKKAIAVEDARRGKPDDDQAA